MTTLVLALSVLLGAPLAPPQQQDSWAETTFHRIYLRNGNFIDGRVLKETPTEVTVLLKSGEMLVKRDQIDRVELVKMRSWNEKPLVLAPPKESVPGKTSPPVKPPEPGKKEDSPVVKAAIDATPADVRQKVDVMVYKLKATPGPDKQFPVDELKALGDAGAVYLAARMGNLDPKTQELAAGALVMVKCDQTIPVLTDLLGHPSPAVRANCALALAYQNGPARTRYLRPLLRDEDVTVRTTALSLLGSTDDEDLFEQMCDLMSDANGEVRGRAMTIAGRLALKHGKTDAMLRALAALVSDPDAQIRGDALNAIGAIGRADGWPHLAKALRDAEPKVRAIAAQGLLALGVPESADDVLQAIQGEKDRWTRMNLAGVATRLRLVKAIPIFLDWLADPEEDVKTAAETALITLTGEKLGRDRAKWEAWLNSNGSKK